MSDKKIIIYPVDPKGFGLAMLLAFLVKYWKETLVGLIMIPITIGIIIFCNNIAYKNNEQKIEMTETQEWTNRQQVLATAQSDNSTVEASSVIVLKPGETWSKGGLSITVSELQNGKNCESHGFAFGFVLKIDDNTGKIPESYIDYSYPSMVVEESSGYIYSSAKFQQIWYGNDLPDDCSSTNYVLHEDGEKFYNILQQNKHIDYVIRLVKFTDLTYQYGTVDPTTKWVKVWMPEFIPLKNIIWEIPISQ